MKENFLDTPEGKMNAERFVKAAKDGRLFAAIHRPYNGTSLVVGFYEKQDGTPYFLQFNWFLQQLGFEANRRGAGLVLRGGGMDLVHNVIYVALQRLQNKGFEVSSPLKLSNFSCLG